MKHSTCEPAERKRRRRGGKPGQSIVEYGLTLVMIFLLAQGTARAMFQTITTTVTNLRSAFTITDDPTVTPGASPTVRLPPNPPTLTALPATPVVIAMCEIPDLVNYQYNAAVVEWQNYGFASGTLTKPGSASSTFQVGTQSLAKGNTAPCATTSMHVTPKTCPVPDLEGQVFTTARDGAWSTNGFIKANLTRPADTGETFTIGSQQYASGSSLDCEATMLVEPLLCTVPNLAGKTFNINGSGNANATWDDTFVAANLTRGAGMPDSFTVATQSLAAGSITSCEAAMEVKPALCQVPNMVGAQYLGAQTLWVNRGFSSTVAKAAYTPSDFTITAQSQTAGATLPCAGTTVTVQPNMCTVPNMVGQVVSNARNLWTTNGFTLANLGPAGLTATFKVTAQSQTAGLSVACSSAATLTAIDATPYVVIAVPTDGSSGDDDSSSAAPRVEATAYDPEVASGARGISKVVFTITRPGGTTYSITVNAGSNTKYCAFGGNCNRWQAISSIGFPAWNNSLTTGVWKIKATAYPIDSTKSPVTSPEISFTVVE